MSLVTIKYIYTSRGIPLNTYVVCYI